MALAIGLEPTTDRLTADCSTIELSKRMRLKRVSYITFAKVNLQGRQQIFLNIFQGKIKRGRLVPRETALFAELLLNGSEQVADGLEGGQFLSGELDAVFLLKVKAHLDNVEAVQS